MILGHSSGKLSVRARYGRVSDAELLAEIDKLIFDHGPSEILAVK